MSSSPIEVGQHSHQILVQSAGHVRSDSDPSLKEKKSIDVEVDMTVVDDLEDKDEALKLVGLERTQVFSDEQYRKLRRKFVSSQLPLFLCNMLNIYQDLTIPPLCALVYFTQYLYVFKSCLLRMFTNQILVLFSETRLH